MIHWYSEKYSEFLKNNKNPNIKVDKLYLNFRTEFDIYHKCIKLSLYSLQPFQKSKSGRENYDLTKILKFSVQSLIPLYPEIKR